MKRHTLKISGLLLLAASAFTSCTKHSVAVEIVNNGGTTIDSVVVSNGTDNSVFNRITPGATAVGELEFTEKADAEGIYSCSAYRDGSKREINFGEFSKEALDGKIMIDIQKRGIKGSVEK